MPLWGWVLVGWLVSGTLGVWVLGVPDLPPEVEALATDQELPADLSDWSPRELRCLPDIGPRLAVEIAERRWAGELDDPATETIEVNLEAVPGIGPKTSKSVQGFFEKRSGPPGSPGPAALRGPASMLPPWPPPSAWPRARDATPSRRSGGVSPQAGTNG